jgi:predicted nucleic acid-binding protein
MAARTEAYVDTSGFIACLDRSDEHHTVFKHAFADPPALLTSPLVIAEGHAWFLRRFNVFRALEFMDFIDALKVVRVVETGNAQLKEALRYCRKFRDQPLTLADAFGLSLMDRHRIRTCWSTDAHLGLTGVPLLIHER